MHILTLLMLTTGALAGPIQSPTPNQALDATYSPSRSLAPLVQAVQPAVVALEVKTTGQGALSSSSEQRTGMGSGFVISEDGLLLTNAHVVGTAKVVTAHFEDGSSSEAEVVGLDSATDVALLQLHGDKTWTYLSTGTTDDVEVGDWVMAMGNALGMGMTVTAGIVSAKGRGLGHNMFAEDNYIQTDAAINMGNSGGPLFDLEGNVVGINTAIIVGANTMGFAIPIDAVSSIMDDLVTKGKISRGYVGVSPASMRSSLAKYVGVPTNTQGAFLADVFEGTPAANAGLRRGDLIVGIDGGAVVSAESLIRSVGTRKPGEKVTVSLIRQGEAKSITLILGERPTER
ncbi:MAG: trypsin-like serine protease [Rhodobacterales bacterium]|nr:trypsin-like serine protease [Rhodobacterales bacterium]